MASSIPPSASSPSPSASVSASTSSLAPSPAPSSPSTVPATTENKDATGSNGHNGDTDAKASVAVAIMDDKQQKRIAAIEARVIECIKLLDILDKEMKTMIARAREWYGWHFPELSKIITDDMSYIHTIHALGLRSSITNVRLAPAILTEAMAATVTEAAQVSMGSDLTNDDITSIRQLCDGIMELGGHYYEAKQYIEYHMTHVLAPHLTVTVGGALPAARLLARAGSLQALAPTTNIHGHSHGDGNANSPDAASSPAAAAAAASSVQFINPSANQSIGHGRFQTQRERSRQP